MVLILKSLLKPSRSPKLLGFFLLSTLLLVIKPSFSNAGHSCKGIVNGQASMQMELDLSETSSITKYDFHESLEPIYLQMEYAAKLDVDVLRGLNDWLKITAEQLLHDNELHHGKHSRIRKRNIEALIEQEPKLKLLAYLEKKRLVEVLIQEFHKRPPIAIIARFLVAGEDSINFRPRLPVSAISHVDLSALEDLISDELDAIAKISQTTQQQNHLSRR